MMKTIHDPTKHHKDFSRFFICHHCRLLYPDVVLISCEYSSAKSGVPIQPSPYYDPYFQQIIKSKFDDSNRRAATSVSSALHEEEQLLLQLHLERFPFDYFLESGYICERKFCFHCAKNNYEISIDKNGHCPFCQGTCYCTRCSRAETIVKLKSLYLLLGGDVNELQ